MPVSSPKGRGVGGDSVEGDSKQPQRGNCITPGPSEGPSEAGLRLVPRGSDVGLWARPLPHVWDEDLKL